MPDVTIIGGTGGPDNFARGDRALKALVTYTANPADIDISDEAQITETGDHVVIVPGSTIAYLVADLCHVMRRVDVTVGETIASAMQHFGSDVLEQAWEHNEGWNNQLQHADNIPLAREVMTAAGVPDEAHDGALRLSGLLPPCDEKEGS